MSSELVVLDVGHGNATVVRSEGRTVVVDGAPGSELLEYLRREGISEVDSVLLSHADEDHIGGIVNLLTTDAIVVKRLYANPDASKVSKRWRDLRQAAADARRRKGTEIHSSLTTTQTGELDTGAATIEVLAPVPELALGGPGGNDELGNRTTSNSMSVVLKVFVGSGPSVILAGDLDEVGLQRLRAEHGVTAVDVLVFPHHGGAPGAAGNVEQFAESVLDQWSPTLVLFSIHRSRYGLPREEVVRVLRSRAAIPYIACTQLSQKCAAAIGRVDHLEDIPARGFRSGSSCAGSVRINLDVGGDPYLNLPRHREFVESDAETALCLDRGGS